MTFAVTSEVDDAHPRHSDTDELTSAYSAARHIGEACLADGPVGRVGLEVEAHCFDLADPTRRPDWAELTEVIAGVPPLPGGSAITVDRKSTRLNSSHVAISYAVFCLKK